MRHSTITLLIATVLTTAVPAAAAPGDVRVAKTGAVTAGSRQIFSSSQLAVTWVPGAGDQTHHFEIVGRETAQGTEVRASAAASATAVTLTGLKALTTYVVTVRACANEACSTSSVSASASAETDTEYWQMQGTGNTVARLTTIVSDGNARLSATRFGPDAGAMANRVQLYYGPMATNRQSQLSAAVASGTADAAIPGTYLTFTSRAGSSGLIAPSSQAPLVTNMATGQGVPVSRDRGGFVRLFFEAQGADGRTRAMWVDSRDGYFGLDFNSGAASTCSTAADYSAGGGCEPTVAIPLESDAGGNSKIRDSRQFKVAWPTLDSTHWDMAVGSFMVFTLDAVTGCSTAPMNHGYAVWDGTKWVVQYRDNGCPKLFTSAQAAFPFHSGGARYRLYYGDPSLTDGRATSGNLPFLGPKKLIYADGSVSGSASVVDFEDWEAQTSARDVVFLWPNGDQMDARAEGYIDDYHFLTPTGDPNLQVMYITITDGAIAPIAVAAVLLNP
ncbi:MAG: fibronectin type III domain-containing protein [Acidobacteriota bacterium]|nr:fibronectin type III domain-containing protein [Acidobacteriota bacterium]